MPSANATSGSGADEVVLTGLSGRLPESGSIDEFADQLFEGVDLVTADDRRWTPGTLLRSNQLLFINFDTFGYC